MKDDSISRQAAIDALADYIHLIDKTMSTGLLSAEDCKDTAESVLGEDELPPVDAVPVVRCKDCKFSKPINAMVIECTIWADARLKADFCSAGERKERDNDS